MAVTIDNSPYAPPASRPADGGIARTTKGTLRVGFGLGWATIAFTFLWVAVALPMKASASGRNSLIEGLVFLALLIVPTLALLGYFARRREWMGMLGALLAWASAVALVLLLLAVLRMGSGFAD